MNSSWNDNCRKIIAHSFFPGGLYFFCFGGSVIRLKPVGLLGVEEFAPGLPWTRLAPATVVFRVVVRCVCVLLWVELILEELRVKMRGVDEDWCDEVDGVLMLRDVFLCVAFEYGKLFVIFDAFGVADGCDVVIGVLESGKLRVLLDACWDWLSSTDTRDRTSDRFKITRSSLSHCRAVNIHIEIQ